MAKTLKSSRVIRAGEWTQALLGAFVLGPAGYFAAAYLEADPAIALGAGAALAIAGVVGAFISYKSTCPGCGLSLRFSNIAVEDGEGRMLRPVRDGYVHCPGCRRYSVHRGEELVELEPEHLAARPVFQVRGTELGPYSPEAPSPETCAACGEPAVAAEVYPLLVASEEVALGAMLRMQKAQVELGHCAAHEDAAQGDGYVIWLRSYPVWRRISRS